MDCAVKHLENASDAEAMVNKLCNMQWLKKTSHSPTCEKTKTVYKQIHDDNKSDIAKDKILSTENLINRTLSTENVTTSLVEESVAYCSTDTHEKHLSSDTVPENNANMLIKDIDAANLFPNINELVVEKSEEEEMLSIVESIVTAKVEAQFDADKEQKDQPNVSQSNAENNARTDNCSNFSNPQKIDQDTKEQNLTKNSDDNNNHSTSAAPIVSKVNNEEKSTSIITDTETCKASTKIKVKDVHMKKATNEPKVNFKNGCNPMMDVGSKSNEKSSTSNNDSKKLISNSSRSLRSSRSPRFIDKNERLDRFNNKTGFTKNIAYIKRREFVKQQHSVSKSGTDKETKDVKSNVVKTDLKTESNKTPETCHSKNTNKDKIVQKQHNVSKQFVSKLKKEESFKRSTCRLNQSIDKNKQLEKVTNASKNSDVLLSDSEKKGGKTVEEKNFEDNKKMNCGVNFKRNTTFVMQNKNLSFSKPLQTIPKNIEQPLTDGKNLTYTRNNQRFNRKHSDNAEHKAVIKKEYTSTNKFSKSNVENKEMCANNLENDSKWHQDVNRTQSSNVKSTNTNKIGILASDNKNINSVKAETCLIGDKKDVNSSVELNTCAEPETMEQCRKETKEAKETDTIDKSKVDIDHRLTDMSNKMNNDKINPSKYSNLHLDKSTVESQSNMLYQHTVKSESIQCMDDANQLESNQTVWYNNSFNNSLYKSAIVMNSQQSIQNMPFNMQQTQVTQAGNQMSQISQWKQDNKLYDQHCSSTSDMMHFLQIPNTLDVISSCDRKYECNVQTPPSCESASLLETTMNGENVDLLYKCTPTIQQRSVAAHSHFPNHPISSDQIGSCRWSPSIQDGFYVEHPYDTTQLTTMNVYNPEVFSPDDFNNSHMTNYSQSMVYASPSCMQTWNPQLQYSTSEYLYNSPCANYAIFPNTPSQLNNFTDICPMHEQHEYVPYVQMNEYARSTHSDPNNCVRQTRNFADNILLKSNQYYKNKNNPDNCRTVHNVPQYITRSRQQSMNFTADINQSNPYYSPNQKYHKQNPMQMSRNVKSQPSKISSSQDLVCDDNGPEVVPPIISPKEFITSKVNYSNKINQSSTRVFKPEFKARPNTSYHPLKVQKYSGGFQRNVTCQGFSKEYTPSINIGRGTRKFKNA